MVAKGELLEREEVARIQFQCVLKIAQSLIVRAPPARDEPSQLEDPRSIWHCAAGNVELGQRAVEITIGRVTMICAREVRFAGIRLQPERRLHSRVGQGPPRRSVLTQPVQCVVRIGELVLCGEKGGIACQSLVEQIDPGAQVLRGYCAEAGVKNEVLGPAVEFKSTHVCGRTLLNRALLGGRELRLQLIGNGFRDLTLNSKNIRQIAIVRLRPQMRVIAGIDQLRVDPHFVRCALHAALDQVRHAELLSDFAQIALRASFVLHHGCATDHLQVGDFCQIGQNFILHTVGEEGVLFFVAQVFERQNGDALLKNSSCPRFG